MRFPEAASGGLALRRVPVATAVAGPSVTPQPRSAHGWATSPGHHLQAQRAMGRRDLHLGGDPGHVRLPAPGCTPDGLRGEERAPRGHLLRGHLLPGLQPPAPRQTPRLGVPRDRVLRAWGVHNRPRAGDPARSATRRDNGGQGVHAGDGQLSRRLRSRAGGGGGRPLLLQGAEVPGPADHRRGPKKPRHRGAGAGLPHLPRGGELSALQSQPDGFQLRNRRVSVHAGDRGLRRQARLAPAVVRVRQSSRLPGVQDPPRRRAAVLLPALPCAADRGGPLRHLQRSDGPNDRPWRWHRTDLLTPGLQEPCKNHMLDLV
jgi:hypothetical protein